MDIVAKRRIFLTISLVLAALSAVVLGTEGLNLGIDFTSGTTITYQFADGDPGTADVTSALTASGHSEAIVQALGDDQYFIRTDDLGVSGLDDVNAEVLLLDPGARVLDTSTVGASVAEDTVRNAITAVIVAAVFVMLYIMYAFRSVPYSYKYAFAAIVALAHDVVIVLGAFAVLGIAINAEVNAIFIVGILTVIGYSVNDTIVIFDRIRENVNLAPGRDFRSTVNLSINESITRSLGTSITTMTVILAMLLFGGASLRDFLIVLLAGVLIGTYSSIFIAAQVLVLWERRGFLPWRETAPTNS
ncbi:MAG TPA: protein translocase subunit SecF [Dehalococcoidia bacterium]|jgi:preprotein translocase subunit SecF|nr:protein translocase subunit SecF [Chloroflexota bacterium]MDP6055652.1 protein translocase subunit SecF [Dehalococcoidia bacterium]MDP7090508.1 protein translocase subunit SecF [Dehalococcoidia bacterium]MDP7261267.1 protein translocase subunit SecF [Dehalococcoidia bacterium]MDP7485393.1 protein translocase subunit SecF [Dehalococcoidia bacterium]|tara:strand:+ start:934 stop:1842 length:909 start_codon:yes stop_codon:yes gene_type:complete